MSDEDSVRYILNRIRHICTQLKTRAPGSEGEREAASYFEGILRGECSCTDVRVETFAEHPDSFYGYFYFSMALDIGSCIGFFVHPAIGFVSGFFALFLFVAHFLLYRQPIDFLFPKKNGTNLTAVRPCSGQVKRRVFLNGHLDAAWELPLNYYCGGILFEVPGLMALIGVLFYMTLAVLSMAGCGPAVRQAALWGIGFVPFFALVGITYNPKRIVAGANDNLTGCLIPVALLRELEREGICLENTEIGVILTGSEEAGLRGAKAWCRKHGKEYGDVPTFIISFDTIHDPKYLAVNRRDLNGTVVSDGALCDLFLASAAQAEVACGCGWVPPFGGSTDSAAFTQGGFGSMAVTGLNHRLESYYHTRLDTQDNLNPEGIRNCLRAARVMLERLDGGELD